MHRLRRATSADISAYAGRDMPDWCARWEGWAAEHDGVIGGLGLACWDGAGNLSGWFDARERLSAFLIHKTALATLRSLAGRGERLMRVYCDETKPRAAEWLLRLGFLPTEQVIEGHGRVWICSLSA